LSALYGTPPALQIVATDHTAGVVVYPLDLPVGATVTSITLYIAVPGGSYDFRYSKTSISGSTFVDTAIHTATAAVTAGAVVFNVTDTLVAANEGHYIYLACNPSGGTTMTVYGLTVAYTSPSANLRA
jgi:hypothetical protein